MGQVSAASTILINVEPAATLAAVADYQKVRPRILSPQYSEYEVLQGGQGAGTVAKWKLQATKARVRDVQVDIGGFFEKTFAPLGLKKIQAEVLANLKKDLES